jgi:hypothetical protein
MEPAEPWLDRRVQDATNETAAQTDKENDRSGPADRDVADPISVRGERADQSGACRETSDAHDDAAEKSADEHPGYGAGKHCRADMPSDGRQPDHSRALHPAEDSAD